MMMTGLILPLIVVASTGAVDYSNAVKVKSASQRVLDAAVIIGARTYRETDDEAEATAAMRRYLDNQLSQKVEGTFEHTVSVEIRDTSGKEE
jgi:Flp pilus assembly protein TadG